MSFLGNILAVTGLDKAKTGDMLLTNRNSLNKLNNSGVVLPSLNIPAPVFMCSIEPYSNRELKALTHALNCITREDPSIR